MSRAAARRAFDHLERLLGLLAARHPGPAITAAGSIGRLRNRLSARWPAPEEVRALFPHLDRREAERVAWSLGGLEARNRLLVACLRRGGPAAVRPLLHPPPAELTELRPPMILGTFHVGAIHVLGAALEALPGPVLALRLGRLHEPEGPVEIVSTEGSEQARAAVFLRLLEHLQAGGFVALALDEVPGPGLRVPCLGRGLALARGPFALARLTDAPLSPIVTRWREGKIAVEVGGQLRATGPDFEAALAAEAARWLGEYLLGSPSEVGLGLLRGLLGQERT